ncbi:Hypothetical Protein RradSPS_0285 [Rubrobacter radiotolerans]|uniref:Uncharacterized protein n=1 Tax=Rubrobacter radiotolerans TaxID=42256 RepID=A0A023WZU6_RUBRA|nr:hypothetical protein [Rubrobacter radiotolerans]AHY45568.1 Hypothetical Protein RradSPS_0285 [Rubrobacter radiotolerans]MDX5892982.1 hypothetical protein [Rubrobacter radiotolerans]SMC02852.1 conserved hypothetical protein [Rubrobacter radiotolerans DSM 5868]
MTQEKDAERIEQQRADSGYTVVGVIEDGAELNRAVREIRDLGIGRDDLTVILKRKSQDGPEPFPDGTRYIVVPDDRRGLETVIGFGVAFIVIGIFFIFTTPAIGIPTFMVFASLAAILFAGSFSRVGVEPIMTDMEAPREEASSWNEEFEEGKVLVFANTEDRTILRPLREILQRSGATYYLVKKRLEPRAVHQATLYRARSNDRMSSGAQEDSRGDG